ncbi:MAG: hypothetical protein ACTSRK_17415 [Promethearchaeota archaeon]
MVIYLYYDQILRRLSESGLLIPLIIIVSIGVEFINLLKKWIVRRPSKQERKARRKERKERKGRYTWLEDKFQGEVPFEKHVD